LVRRDALPSHFLGLQFHAGAPESRAGQNVPVGGFSTRAATVQVELRLRAHRRLGAEYHVYQGEREVYNGNKRWSDSAHRFRACAFTEGGARKELNDQIEAALAAEHQRIMNIIARESDAFHRTPGGQPVTTRCSLCAGSYSR
jgi:hypothetical protein